MVRGARPHAAAIERKLRVAVTDAGHEQDLNADDLARRCQRLVVLGGPGSGKTWLAKRSARRCAEAALEALGAGASLDEVELPLYTTCSHLIRAGGDIREAAVSSAVDQLADLGGNRLSSTLRRFFTDRNASTLLVLDSLDEAHGSGERLRQADTLPWRIILTSRAIAWNYQLVVDEGNDSHRIGELQPLLYPDDVNSFVHRWFVQQPDRGEYVAAAIAGRPDLQPSATIPLILAFYCIVGGGGKALPDSRRDLYTLVLNRLLTGRWRAGHSRLPDLHACLEILEAWAWSGCLHDPLSGVATWADDIATEQRRLDAADEKALDHVAAPLGAPDVDTGKTLRRFIHRSIREHLVARHVAGLSAEQAATVLLPHLWYDPDWEYVNPAAIVAHANRDQLLRVLLRSATGSSRIPSDLAGIDAGWQIRELLVRIAAESHETDWSPEIAALIGRARVELAPACGRDAARLGQRVPRPRRHADPPVRRQVMAATAICPLTRFPNTYAHFCIRSRCRGSTAAQAGRPGRADRLAGICAGAEGEVSPVGPRCGAGVHGGGDRAGGHGPSPGHRNQPPVPRHRGPCAGGKHRGRLACRGRGRARS